MSALDVFAWSAIAAPAALSIYAYVVYPAVVRLIGARGRPEPPDGTFAWPTLSVLIVAYNEAHRLSAVIDDILAQGYPAPLQVLVVSDGSSDATAHVVAGFASQGVELLALAQRKGKTAGENEAAGLLTGEIVVHVDAGIRLASGALARLIRAFRDPTVAVASGQDVTFGVADGQAGAPESHYVNLEMKLRESESRWVGIVGASGCFYAARAELSKVHLPVATTRDFASPLLAYERGWRAVSVPDALCYVSTTRSLRAEYHRKVRTMSGGLATLWHMRSMLNPARNAAVAWILMSHKLARWLAFAFLPLAGLGVLALSFRAGPLYTASLVGLLFVLGAATALFWSGRRELPRLIGVACYAVMCILAGIAAWLRVLSRGAPAVWEPTPREAVKRT